MRAFMLGWQANIHALLESELAVEHVLSLLGNTVLALDHVDQALDEYVSLVKVQSLLSSAIVYYHVLSTARRSPLVVLSMPNRVLSTANMCCQQPLRHDADRVAEQEAMLRVQATNNAKLKDELHDILVQMQTKETGIETEAVW
jgi:hypothetical protein